MKKGAKASLLAVGVVLFIVSTLVQNSIDPKRDKIQRPIQGKQQADLIFKLPAPYIIASFTGMRETVASLLWVRADEFFHEGNFDAILPLVRIITWMDPHYLDVYKTGAWHLDFNITDSQQRSDRRFIPPALSLMAEGFRNNSNVYDIPMALAFTHHYMKRKDYAEALRWMKIAATKPDLSEIGRSAHEPYPVLVKRLVAHMYEKTGDIEGAKKAWRVALAASAELAKKYPTDASFYTAVQIAKRNYALMLWREQHRKWDIYPPVDVKFNPKWVRTKPRVLVVSGSINLMSRADYLKLNPAAPLAEKMETTKVRLEALKADQTPDYIDGARIDMRLEDIDYKQPTLKEFSWEIPKHVTIMQDSTRIAHGKFELEIDMSRDPQNYPFTKDKYRLILTFDPRGAPDFIQDRIGWKGEGMIDKNYLDTKTIPGVRMLRKEFIINRKDLI